MSETMGVGALDRRLRRHAWLVASAVVVGSYPGQMVFAQVDMPSVAQAATVQFDIRAQSLDAALIEFSRQSGIQVSAETSTIAGKQSAGGSGRMSPEQALTMLLSGTGLVYRRAGTMLVVQGPSSAGSGIVLDPVQVQGMFPVPPLGMIDNAPPPYAGGQVATGGQLGLLGNRGVMDTPFNQTNFTAKKAQDQQAKTVRDVLIDDPSVRASIADGTGGADNVRIRGFTVGPEGTTYGGLFGILPSRTLMVELAERVEVLKGPSAMLNGMSPFGGIGGTINVVPKRAPDEELTQVTANYLSAGNFGGHVDLARRLGPDKEFGVRFNGVYRGGPTAVSNNTDERGLGILGLDFRGDRVRLSADFGFQGQYVGGVISYIGLNNGVPLPWAPNAQMNQGQPWSYVQRRDAFGVVRAEVDMTESITAYASFGAHDERVQALLTSANLVTNAYGAATAAAPLTSNAYTTQLSAEAGVRAQFVTGPIGHEAAATVSTYENVQGYGFGFGGGFATNIYNPSVVARPNIAFANSNKAATQGVSSIGIADTMTAADKRVQLTAGVRIQNVTSQNYDMTTGQPTSGYDQSAVSPSVALIFKPWQNVSIYGNYIQGLQQGTVVTLPFANAGTVLSPYVSTQFEAGVKVDWGKFTTTASLFQITQPFTLTNVTANTLYLGGQQRNQGLELNVFGEPYQGVRLLGGAMFLNPILTSTQGGTTDGWVAPFSPQFTLNLAGEWDLPFLRGFTATGRVVYTGSQYVDTTYPRRSLPEWTRFDIGARYAFDNPGAKGKLLVARFNIDNVLGTSYWESGNGVTTLMLGNPRTFRLSLAADF